MKPKKENSCAHAEQHSGHVCELESQEQWEAIKCVTDNPRVRCENCGTAANSAKYVCIPGDL